LRCGPRRHGWHANENPPEMAPAGGIFRYDVREEGYFSDELIELNVPLMVVPKPFTAAMIAIEIPAAIRPYSIAVAPD
jgi:hypothetical protein